MSWKSTKQQTVANSTIEAEYIAVSEATEEAVWMKKFISELGIILEIEGPVPLYYDNTRVVAQAKEPRAHHKSKHIFKHFHLVREFIERQEVYIKRVETKNNIANPFTKALSLQQLDRHIDCMGIKHNGDWL